MTTRILRLAFKLLRNGEYIMFIEQVIKILEKYEMEALHLKKAFIKLAAMLPQLAKIKAQEASSEISAQLHDLDIERDILFNAIMNLLSNMATARRESQMPHVKVLNHFFDTEGRDIASDTYNSETKRLNDLFKDYDDKPEVQAAAEALNLKIYFDPLREANAKFDEKFLLRNEQDSSIEKVDTRAIREATDKTLTSFFAAIEFCSNEYEELDYVSLSNELNLLLSYYKTLLKTRATRRANDKDKGEDKPSA